MSEAVTPQAAAERARAYVTAAGAEVREDELLTASARAVAEVTNLCGGPFAPDSLLEETASLAAGYYLLLPDGAADAAGQAVSGKEGDTQVQYSEENAPPAMRRRLAEDLIDGARRDCTRWRRLIW